MDLRTQIEAAGISMPEGTSEETMVKLAKALGVTIPRKVVLAEYKGGQYAQVPAIPYKDADGAERKTRPYSIRVEAIDTLIEDLQKAKELLA